VKANTSYEFDYTIVPHSHKRRQSPFLECAASARDVQLTVELAGEGASFSLNLHSERNWKISFIK
jgi:hypothetical protein